MQTLACLQLRWHGIGRQRPSLFHSNGKPVAAMHQDDSVFSQSRAHSRAFACPPTHTHPAPAPLQLHTLPVSKHCPFCRHISTMAAIAQKSAVAGRVQGLSLKTSRRALVVVASGGGKTDITKVGLNSIEEGVVKQNLMGKSRFMGKKGWVDAQGRKGKGYGVYKYADKYGANVDGYSPIYTPDLWTEGGDSYKLGTKGLLAWAGLVLVLLAIGLNLIVSTSQLGA